MTFLSRSRYSFLIFLAVLLPQTVLGDSDLTDAEKKEIVYEMYEGYKKEFPLVKDISPPQAMQQMETAHVLFILIHENRLK